MPSIGLTIPFALINSFGRGACKLLPWPPERGTLRGGWGIPKYEDKLQVILQDWRPGNQHSSNWKHFTILHLNLTSLLFFLPFLYLVILSSGCNHLHWRLKGEAVEMRNGELLKGGEGGDKQIKLMTMSVCGEKAGRELVWAHRACHVKHFTRRGGANPVSDS